MQSPLCLYISPQTSALRHLKRPVTHTTCGRYCRQSSRECSYYNLRYDLPKSFVIHFLLNLCPAEIAEIADIFILTKTKKTPLCDSRLLIEPLPSLSTLLLVSELPAISITNNGTLCWAAITQRKNQRLLQSLKTIFTIRP